MRSKPPSGRRRSRRPLVVITLLAVTLITIDAVGGNTFDPVRNVATDVFSPMGDGVSWVTTPFRNAWNGITGYNRLEDENAELRRELTERESEGIENENALEELDRLKKEANLEVPGDLPSEIARVATGANSNFDDYRMEIDKGASSGLEVGNPVTAGGGLVGRIVRVAEHRSTVQLVTDPALYIGVRIGDTQDIGVGHGSGTGNPFVVSRGISIESKVKVHDAVLTSGLNLAIMPRYVVIGRVAEVQPDEGAQNLILRVDFAAKLSQLDVVTVLKWTPAS